MESEVNQKKTYSEESFLTLKSKKSKSIYFRLKKIIQSFGEFDILFTSQQVVFSKAIPFFYVQTKGLRSLDFFFILDRQAYHKTIERVEGPVGVLNIHVLKLRQVTDIDDSLIRLLREAYREEAFPLRKTVLNDFQEVEEHYLYHQSHYSRFNGISSRRAELTH